MSSKAPTYTCIGSSTRISLYTVSKEDDGSEKYTYTNPVYSYGSDEEEAVDEKGEMRLRDFLSSIPSFAEFSDPQLIALEQQATFASYPSGSIVFKQGEPGDAFYVIQTGKVEVLIQSNPMLIRKGEYGKVVNSLSAGFCFGERALMTSEPRAATIKAVQDTTCLVFSRAVYEEVISGSSALLGKDSSSNVDWSRDHETRSLYKHVETVLDIENKSTSPHIRRTLYELSTAFTPELSVDEVISRMVINVKQLLKADRVGLFVLSEDKRSMVLKVSERSKGIRLPVRGLAGAVLTSNQPLNIPDAYQDARFDPTMDRRTGYRTKQVLGVPIFHPISRETVGLLQVNNKSDGSIGPFSQEQERILTLAGDQLSELLHGREEVFIYSGMQSRSQYFGANDGSNLMNTADIDSPFIVDISSLSLTQPVLDIIAKESLTVLEITVSVFLALTPLCTTKTVQRQTTVDLPRKPLHSSPSMSSASFYRMSDLNAVPPAPGQVIAINDHLQFDIAVKDLPRAARVLIRLGGKKKAGATTRVPLGWAATTIFDFKACVENQVDLKLFPDDNEVPINTTLSNTHDLIPPSSISMAVMPDLFGDGSRRSFQSMRIVHTMPVRSDPIESDSAAPTRFNEDTLVELERIRLISFNPMCASVMTADEKEFVWGNRYNILDRADLLPAFVLSVKWNQAERVQELYDLLDLWRPPAPVLALQLLDRRFMDPKVSKPTRCLSSSLIHLSTVHVGSSLCGSLFGRAQRR
jgi:CRP-like cAMP-binding protein